MSAALYKSVYAELTLWLCFPFFFSSTLVTLFSFSTSIATVSSVFGINKYKQPNTLLPPSIECEIMTIRVPTCYEATAPAPLVLLGVAGACWKVVGKPGAELSALVRAAKPCCLQLSLLLLFCHIKLQWISTGVVHAKSILKRVSVSVLIQWKLIVNWIVKVINGNNYSAFKWSAVITLCINLDGWNPWLQKGNGSESRLLPPISFWLWSALAWGGDPGPKSSTQWSGEPVLWWSGSWASLGSRGL